MRRTDVRRSSEAIAATQQLASFCDAINELVNMEEGTMGNQNKKIDSPHRF